MIGIAIVQIATDSIIDTRIASRAATQRKPMSCELFYLAAQLSGHSNER